MYDFNDSFDIASHISENKTFMKHNEGSDTRHYERRDQVCSRDRCERIKNCSVNEW